MQTVTIKPDGSLVVNYYYTRNTYKLGGDDSSGNSTSISAKMELKVQMAQEHISMKNR